MQKEVVKYSEAFKMQVIEESKEQPKTVAKPIKNADNNKKISSPVEVESKPKKSEPIESVAKQKSQAISEPKPAKVSNIKETKLSNSKTWIWLVVIGVVAMIIFAFIIYSDYLLPDNRKKANDIIATANTESDLASDSSFVDESVTNSDTIIKNSSVAAKQDKTSAKEVSVNNSTSTKKEFFVIAGCFRSQIKADEYLIDLRTNGYPNASIQGKTSGGLTRVCYDSFETRSAANRYLDKVSTKENKELWIQRIK